MVTLYTHFPFTLALLALLCPMITLHRDHYPFPSPPCPILIHSYPSQGSQLIPPALLAPSCSMVILHRAQYPFPQPSLPHLAPWSPFTGLTIHSPIPPCPILLHGHLSHGSLTNPPSPSCPSCSMVILHRAHYPFPKALLSSW